MTAAPPRPGVNVELRWTGGLRFDGRAGARTMTLDGDGEAGPSPVQSLALSLASCMAIDVVHILTKGRVPLQALTVRLEGERAAEDPRRLVSVRLHFAVNGDVAADKVERALALSSEKYCSVWHSLRQDIDFTTSFEISA